MKKDQKPAPKEQNQSRKKGMKPMPVNHRNSRRCNKQTLKQMYGL